MARGHQWVFWGVVLQPDTMEQSGTARGIEILRFNKRTGRFISKFTTVDYEPKGKIMIWYILLAVMAVIGIIALIASTKRLTLRVELPRAFVSNRLCHE